jgi:hypothetical protein
MENILKEINSHTTEEIELWSVTQYGLELMVGYCSYFARQEGVSKEQKAKLADQRGKYYQKAHSLSYDMEENNRILSKYSPWIKGDKVTLDFLLNDEI